MSREVLLGEAVASQFFIVKFLWAHCLLTIQVCSQLTFCYALTIDDMINNHIYGALEAFES